MAKKNENEIIVDSIVEDATTECLVKLKGREKETYLLFEAIADNNLRAAEDAIKRGADTNASCKPCSPESEETPLDAAIYWAGSFDCSIDMIKLLRKYGARSLNRDMDKFFEEGNDCLLEKHIRQNKS